VVREEKNKKISKEENETEVLSESQTVEEVQKIFDELKEYYDDKEEEEKNNKLIREVIFDKFKKGDTSLQISKEFTEYYNANKSNIHFYENYFSNLKYKSLEEDKEEKEENNQKNERKLKRQRDSDDEHDNEEKKKKRKMK
jgi:hypothetical protein